MIKPRQLNGSPDQAPFGLRLCRVDSSRLAMVNGAAPDGRAASVPQATAALIEGVKQGETEELSDMTAWIEYRTFSAWVSHAVRATANEETRYCLVTVILGLVLH